MYIQQIWQTQQYNKTNNSIVLTSVNNRALRNLAQVVEYIFNIKRQFDSMKLRNTSNQNKK